MAAALLLVAACGLVARPSPAQAQFVCGGSATGAEAQTGAGAVATSANDVACGSGASAAGGGNGTSFGFSAGTGAVGPNNTAVGFTAGQIITGLGFNTAIGSKAGRLVTGDHNTATGADSGQSVSGQSNVAYGNASGGNVTGNSNVAMGNNAGRQVTGSSNVAIGDGAGSNIGSVASVSNTVSIGNAATASGDSGIAVGVGATASGSSATAIGPNATAAFSGSAAFGEGAKATRQLQQVFGTQFDSYTLAGINTASTAAQVGPTKLVTADSTGTLGVTTPAALGLAGTGDITNLQGQINDLFRRDSQLRQGIAMASAAPHSIVLPGENFSLDVDWANYGGANAMGVGSAVRLGAVDVGGGTKVSVQGNVGVGFGVDGGNQAVTRAGIRLGW